MKYVDPHFGSTLFLNLLQLIWPDGAFLGGHVSIPDWLSWNQNSVFESQSEIDTWQGGICKSCRLLRGSRPAAGGRSFWLEEGVLWRCAFSIRERKAVTERECFWREGDLWS